MKIGFDTLTKQFNFQTQGFPSSDAGYWGTTSYYNKDGILFTSNTDEVNDTFAIVQNSFTELNESLHGANDSICLLGLPDRGVPSNNDFLGFTVQPFVTFLKDSTRVNETNIFSSDKTHVIRVDYSVKSDVTIEFQYSKDTQPVISQSEMDNINGTIPTVNDGTFKPENDYTTFKNSNIKLFKNFEQLENLKGKYIHHMSKNSQAPHLAQYSLVAIQENLSSDHILFAIKNSINMDKSKLSGNEYIGNPTLKNKITVARVMRPDTDSRDGGLTEISSGTIYSSDIIELTTEDTNGTSNHVVNIVNAKSFYTVFDLEQYYVKAKVTPPPEIKDEIKNYYENNSITRWSEINNESKDEEIKLMILPPIVSHIMKSSSYQEDYGRALPGVNLIRNSDLIYKLVDYATGLNDKFTLNPSNVFENAGGEPVLDGPIDNAKYVNASINNSRPIYLQLLTADSIQSGIFPNIACAQLTPSEMLLDIGTNSVYQKLISSEDYDSTFTLTLNKIQSDSALAFNGSETDYQLGRSGDTKELQASIVKPGPDNVFTDGGKNKNILTSVDLSQNQFNISQYDNSTVPLHFGLKSDVNTKSVGFNTDESNQFTVNYSSMSRNLSIHQGDKANSIEQILLVLGILILAIHYQPLIQFFLIINKLISWNSLLIL